MIVSLIGHAVFIVALPVIGYLVGHLIGFDQGEEREADRARNAADRAELDFIERRRAAFTEGFHEGQRLGRDRTLLRVRELVDAESQDKDESE